MNIKKELGAKIRDLRKEKSYTQEALAEMLNISPKSLSQIELGNNFISEETLESLCNALNVKPHVLFKFEGEKKELNILEDIHERLSHNDKLKHTIYKIILALDE